MEHTIDSHDRAGLTSYSIPITSCTTFLISLQQMDSHYRYPIPYNVGNTNHTVAIACMRTKNARANQLVDIEVDILHVPPSAKLLTYQFTSSSLPCHPCIDICMRIIHSGMSQIQPEGGPTLQLLGIWIENRVENNHHRFVLKVKSRNERKSIRRPLLTRVRSRQHYFFHLTQTMKPNPDRDLTSRLYG